MGPDRHQITIDMGAGTAIAAGTSQDVHWVCPFPGSWQIKNPYLMPHDDVSAHASNGTTLSMEVGATTLDSHNTLTGQDGALTGGTPVALAQPSGAAAVIEQGDVVTFGKTDAASGQAFTGSLVFELVQV